MDDTPDGILMDIIVAKNNYWTRHGIEPDTVYLGFEDIRRMKERLEKLKPSTPANTDEHTLYGMNIVQVNAVNWIAVAHEGTNHVE